MYSTFQVFNIRSQTATISPRACCSQCLSLGEFCQSCLRNSSKLNSFSVQWRHRYLCSSYQPQLSDRLPFYSGMTKTSTYYITLAVSSGKHNVTVWRPSICLSRRHTHRDSPGGSMQCSQHTFRSDSTKFNHGLGQILHDELHWLDVSDRVFFKLAVTVHRCLNGCAPPYRTTYCIPAAGADTWRHLRSANCQLLAVPRYQLNTYSCRAFSAVGPIVWNSLPDFIRHPTISVDCFRRLLKTYLFARY